MIPADWPSGVYLGRLSRVPNPDGTMPWQSYVVFIVRDDRPADILFQCPDNTWQAYNRWPDSYSLYIDPGNKFAWCNTTVDVSFDRPYGKYVQIYENPQSVGSGEFLCWEFPLCYWLEQHGYDVSYCSNSDMLTPDRAAKCKAFISVGHDEYWDLRQYESVQQIARSGTCVLFLSGNAVCYVTPFRAGADGRPNRIISRKGPFQGLTMGPEPPQTTFEYVGPDEGLLLGARNILPVQWRRRLGLRQAGALDFRRHRHEEGRPDPRAGGLGIPRRCRRRSRAWRWWRRALPCTAARVPSPTRRRSTRRPKAASSSTPRPSSGPPGLSAPPGHMPLWSHNTRPNGPDPRVQQITHNLLRRAIHRW